jgi:hypothetical protein
MVDLCGPIPVVPKKKMSHEIEIARGEAHRHATLVRFDIGLACIGDLEFNSVGRLIPPKENRLCKIILQ